MANFIYTMSIIVVPKEYLYETQKILNKFIWGGKLAKVKHIHVRARSCDYLGILEKIYTN